MDHILYWNNVALEANRRDFSNVPGENKPQPEQGGPTLSSRALAIIHLAMYDAHAGVKRKPDQLPPYISTPVPEGATNAAAAVAAAAHACLCELFPRQSSHFDEAYDAACLSEEGLDDSRSFGLDVARAILTDRELDPSASDDGYTPSMKPNAHRKDPANPGQGFHAPFYGAQSKGFAITVRHELDSPLTSLSSYEHEFAIEQVRGKGITPELMGTLPETYEKRTINETAVGIYWAYDGPRELGTPPRLYNQIIRKIAVQQCNNDDDNARLFALVNVAMGDAGILAWDQKYIHNFWRPVLGVREHDPSMGPEAPTPNDSIANGCDPDWLPLGAPASNSYVDATGSADRNFTPPFPAYPSGHATFGAAAFQMTRLFYMGDEAKALESDKQTILNGDFVSDELNGITRDNHGVVRSRHRREFKDGLLQMIEENGFSRVWLGVHWYFDAFALQNPEHNSKPDLSRTADGNFKRNIGGVPLGIKIAEDIFTTGNGKAPTKSQVIPRS